MRCGGSRLLLVLGLVGPASLQWGYVKCPLVRATLASQKTVSKPLSLFFPALLCDFALSSISQNHRMDCVGKDL